MIFAYQVYYNPVYQSYLINLIEAWVAVIIIVVLFLCLYPVSSIEIFDDRFVYKKGKFVLSSTWHEVNNIAFQYPIGSVLQLCAFFIDSKNGMTKLIDTRILKCKDGSVFKLDDFIQEIESVSGKKFLVGDISLKKYGNGTYYDYEGTSSRK